MFYRKYIGWTEVDQRLRTGGLTARKLDFISYNLKSNGCTTDTNLALIKTFDNHKFILLYNTCKCLQYIQVFFCDINYHNIYRTQFYKNELSSVSQLINYM